MRIKSSFSCLVILLLFTTACRAPVQEKVEDIAASYKRSFLETNQYMRERHREQIVAFTERVGWEMTETSTGLWYMIIEQGEGPQIQKENLITYLYTTRLLNGKICYSADTTAPKKIVVGKGNIEAGVEEGLLLLRRGSKARFILPPHLAHGNFGDMKNIPGSSVLLIEIEILDLKR